MASSVAVNLNGLDLRFSVLLCAAISALMSVIFLQQWRSHRSVVSGFGWWSMAPVALLAGALSLASQPYVPLAISAVFGNMLVSAGLSMFYIGAVCFFGNPAPRWPWLLVSFVGIGIYIAAEIIPDYRSRLLIYSLSIAFIQGAFAKLIWQIHRKTFTGKFLLATTVIAFMLMVTRIVTMGIEDPGGSLFVPSPMQSIFLSAYAFMLLAQTIGLVLLAQERLLSNMEMAANVDFLTKAMSRGAAFAAGWTAVVELGHSAKPLSVLLLDLDNFKQVNDHHGHQAGDDVLRSFTQTVREQLRPQDRLGRLGGEEFLVLLPATTTEEAVAIADQIRQACSGEAGPKPAITVSVGVATLPPGQHRATPAEDFEALIGRADAALYAAKTAGRDRVMASQTSK